MKSNCSDVGLTVYKYCCGRGVEILEHLELKITPPNQFNDPFEFMPQIICSNPLRRSKEVLKNKDSLRKLYALELSNGTFNGSFREYRHKSKNERAKMAAEIADYFPMGIAQERKKVLDKASEKIGLLCLSGVRDSILMWGHYCDKHRGIVIGFDSGHPFFHGGTVGLRQVD